MYRLGRPLSLRCKILFSLFEVDQCACSTQTLTAEPSCNTLCVTTQLNLECRQLTSPNLHAIFRMSLIFWADDLGHLSRFLQCTRSMIPMSTRIVNIGSNVPNSHLCSYWEVHQLAEDVENTQRNVVNEGMPQRPGLLVNVHEPSTLILWVK